MRIAIVSSEFPPGPGGIGVHAFEVARHLHDVGHEVHALAAQAYAPKDEIEAFNASRPFRVVGLSMRGGAVRKGWNRYRQLLATIRELRPDIVLATGQRAVWLSAVAAPRGRIPWLAVGHGSEFASPGAFARFVSRIAYGRAAGVITVSRFTAREMRSMGIHPRRSWVIHNGADDQRFGPVPQREVDRYVTEVLGLEGCRIITTVARVCERKGQHIVIQALPAVLEEVPDVHYVLAGLPEEQTALEALACSEGVADHVHFLGRTEADDVVRLLNASDLFVMTSTRAPDGDVEGFGIAVVEAALCETPAVVSSASGLTEAIADGITGLAVPEGDVPATARALTRLLRNHAERNEMGRAARSRARENQTWRQVVRQFEPLLTDVAGVVDEVSA